MFEVDSLERWSYSFLKSKITPWFFMLSIVTVSINAVWFFIDIDEESDAE